MPTPAKVIPLSPYRRRAIELRVDEALNSEWNRMCRLAEEAWCWRDPESLAALGACVAGLGMQVLADWKLYPNG